MLYHGRLESGWPACLTINLRAAFLALSYNPAKNWVIKKVLKNVILIVPPVWFSTDSRLLPDKIGQNCLGEKYRPQFFITVASLLYEDAYICFGAFYSLFFCPSVDPQGSIRFFSTPQSNGLDILHLKELDSMRGNVKAFSTNIGFYLLWHINEEYNFISLSLQSPFSFWIALK